MRTIGISLLLAVHNSSFDLPDAARSERKSAVRSGKYGVCEEGGGNERKGQPHSTPFRQALACMRTRLRILATRTHRVQLCRERPQWEHFLRLVDIFGVGFHPGLRGNQEKLCGKNGSATKTGLAVHTKGGLKLAHWGLESE